VILICRCDADLPQIASEISSRSSLFGYTATPRQQQDQKVPSAAGARSSSLGGTSSSSKQKSSSGLSTSGSLGHSVQNPPDQQQQWPNKGMSSSKAMQQLDSPAKPDGPNKRFLCKYGLHKAGLFAP
jgi:hypothetical protein